VMNKEQELQEAHREGYTAALEDTVTGLEMYKEDQGGETMISLDDVIKSLDDVIKMFSAPLPHVGVK